LHGSVILPTVNRLLDLLAGRDPAVPLDRAALELATIEFPELEIDVFLALLDSYAYELQGRLNGSENGADYVREANRYLFDELGFSGNAPDYYNPRNSCLNEVLTARVGIPITLSLVYIEIGRRLGMPVRGIGLPGHFIVSYDDGLYCTYIDPFHRGRQLEQEQCFELAREASGLVLEPDPELLRPVENRQILLRMINNLHRAYLSRGYIGKAIEVIDLLIRVNPGSASEYRHRGALHVQNGNMTAARADLARYLQLAPEAADHDEVKEQLTKVQRWLASLN